MKENILPLLFRIPACTIIGILRKNVGLRRLPPWHFIVVAVPFFAAFGVTRLDGFLWCGALTVFALLIQGSFWLTQSIKGEPVDPDDVGTSMDGERDSEWREWGEPIVGIVGGIAALYYHQWILGAWLIFAGICLAIAENPELAERLLGFSKPSWLPADLSPLKQPRIVAAFAVAIIADLIQIPITFIENTGVLLVPGEIADCGLDFLAMGATTLLLGFHWALLPSVFVEAVPELDLIPTWTGCVAFVVWRQKQNDPSPDLKIEDDDDDATPISATVVSEVVQSPIEARLNQLKRKRHAKSLLDRATTAADS